MQSEHHPRPRKMVLFSLSRSNGIPTAVARHLLPRESPQNGLAKRAEPTSSARLSCMVANSCLQIRALTFDGRLASLVADSRFFREWREKWQAWRMLTCLGRLSWWVARPLPRFLSLAHDISLKDMAAPAYASALSSLYPSVLVPTPPTLSYPSPFRLSRDFSNLLTIYSLLSFPRSRSFDLKHHGAQCS